MAAEIISTSKGLYIKITDTTSGRSKEFGPFESDLATSILRDYDQLYTLWRSA